EDSVIRTEPHRLGQAVHALLAVVLGDRASPLAALPRGIAEAGEALAPRPFVHVIEELAALLGRAGSRNGANDRALFDEAGEQAEARAFEMLADVCDQQRIAQVRLVGAIFEQRFLVRDARVFTRRSDALPVGEFLEHA